MPPKKDLTIAKIIGNNIKDFREKSYPGHGGLSKCAEDFKVSPQMWKNWESGRNAPTDENQRKLAKFMGISVPELRGEWSGLGREIILDFTASNFKSTFGYEIPNEVLAAVKIILSQAIDSSQGAGQKEIELVKDFINHYDMQSSIPEQTSSTGMVEDGKVRRLFATLEVAHGALSDIAARFGAGKLDLKIALQAVEEALDILLKAHSKSAVKDKRQSNKAGKRGTGTND